MMWVLMTLATIAMSASCSEKNGSEEATNTEQTNAARTTEATVNCFRQPVKTDPLVARMLKRDSLLENGLTIKAVVPCEHAKDLVMYYKEYVDTDPHYPLTKFVDFPLDHFREMVAEYDGKADHVRVYFGAKPKVVGNRLVSVMTVMFQGANQHSGLRGGYEDVTCNDTQVGTRTYNIGNPCPPPKCPGKSDYYTDEEMDKEPK